MIVPGLLLLLAQYQTYPILPWDYCFVMEGKEDGCKAGPPAQPFEKWLEEPAPRYPNKVESDLGSNQWREIGTLNKHKVRRIDFREGLQLNARLVIEKSPDQYVLLLEWFEGQMPESKIHRVDKSDVLVVVLDNSGLRPSVSTWAWVWTRQGTIRLDIAAAVSQAIAKVAPGYLGYPSGFRWPEAHATTLIVLPKRKDQAPRDFRITGWLEAWFNLQGSRFVLQRAIHWGGSERETVIRRWTR